MNAKEKKKKVRRLKLQKSPSSLSLQHVRSARREGPGIEVTCTTAAPFGDLRSERRLLDLRTSVEEHFSGSIHHRKREKENRRTTRKPQVSVSLYASWRKKILSLFLLLFSIHYTSCILIMIIILRCNFRLIN